MPIYDIVFILTMPMYLFANQKFINCFLGELKYGRKVEFFSYLAFGSLLILLYSFIRIPIILLLFNILSLYLITFNYDSKAVYRIVCVFSVYIFFVGI